MIFAVHKTTKEHRVVPRHDVVYPNRDWRYVEADINGWISWEGGECPLPDRSECSVEHRDGEVYDNTFTGSTWASDWSHTFHDGDIVAYRPILSEPSEPEATEWMIGDRCIWYLGDVCMGEHVILAKDGDTFWIRDDHGGYDMADREELRPIRTDEDKAEVLVEANWINAADELPECDEDDEKCVLCSDGHHVFEEFAHLVSWGLSTGEITHWMPLPAPPGGDT